MEVHVNVACFHHTIGVNSPVLTGSLPATLKSPVGLPFKQGVQQWTAKKEINQMIDSELLNGE